MIRRLMECPSRVWDVAPSEGTLTRTFLTCSGTVNLEASLNSHAFLPEEDIIVKVSIRNYSSREIKRIKVKIVQLSEVPMFNDNQIRDKTVTKIDDPLNLGPGACTNRQFTLVPAVPSRQLVLHIDSSLYFNMNDDYLQIKRFQVLFIRT